MVPSADRIPEAGLLADPAPAIAAPNPPRPPTRTTRAFAFDSICRRSAESVLVSLPDIEYVAPSVSVMRSKLTSMTPERERVAGCT